MCHRVFIALNAGALMAGEEHKFIAMLGLAEGPVSESDFAALDASPRPRIRLAATQRAQEPAAGHPG